MRWMDIVANALLGLLGLFVAFLVFALLGCIYVAIFYKSGYSSPRKVSGKVSNMDYTPPRTTTGFNGKTTTVSTRPAIHDVYLSTNNGNLKLNDVELYQRVRIGEGVSVLYQNKFQKPRFWEGDWEPDGTRVLKVIAVDGEVVDIDSEMPSLPELSQMANNKFQE